MYFRKNANDNSFPYNQKETMTSKQEMKMLESITRHSIFIRNFNRSIS